MGNRIPDWYMQLQSLPPVHSRNNVAGARANARPSLEYSGTSEDTLTSVLSMRRTSMEILSQLDATENSTGVRTR